MARASTPPQIYITVGGGLDAIAFYEVAFGAREEMRQMAEDGKRVLHATLALLGGHLMLSDEFPEFNSEVLAPPSLGGSTATIHINLERPEAVDEVMAAAEKAGAGITMPAQNMFWGA